MRIAIAALAFVLAACGASTQSSDDVPDGDALPYGAIIAVGENWGLQADPKDQAVSITAEDGFEASGVWTPPQSIDGGYRLVADTVTLDLTNAACELNGAPYPMSATVNAGGRTFTGCASMRWDYQLIALMPQIDACIAASPGATWVSYAGPGPNGGVLVRLVADGGGYDCNSADGSAANISSGPRNETLPMPSEHNALFVRARPGETANPGGECYDAPEVRGANNELLGWMMDPMGC